MLASDVTAIEAIRSDVGTTVGALLGVAAVVGLVALGASSARPAASSGSARMSCPQVLSFDGRAWVTDSGTYGGALFPAARRTDHDLLEHLVPSEGEYRLRMVNILDETEHTDALRLRVIDHAPEVQVVPALDGTLLTFAHPSPPFSATDLRGRPALEDVTARDQRLWRSDVSGRHADRPEDLRDGVELEFHRPTDATTARLWLTATTTPWANDRMLDTLARVGPALDGWYARLGDDPSARAALTRSMVREGMLQVSVWTGDRWEPRGFYWESGPEILKDQALVVPLGGVVGDRLRLRLDAPVGFWVIDAVAADYGPDAPLDVRELAPRSALRSDGTDLTEVLSTVDGREHTAERGDEVELRYDAPPLARGMGRSIVLASTGWYHIHVTPRPDGSPESVERMLGTPGALSRLSLESLQSTIFEALLR